MATWIEGIGVIENSLKEISASQKEVSFSLSRIAEYICGEEKRKKEEAKANARLLLSELIEEEKKKNDMLIRDQIQKVFYKYKSRISMFHGDREFELFIKDLREALKEQQTPSPH